MHICILVFPFLVGSCIAYYLFLVTPSVHAAHALTSKLAEQEFGDISF